MEEVRYCQLETCKKPIKKNKKEGWDRFRKRKFCNPECYAQSLCLTSWSEKYNSCLECGTTKYPHRAKGLCIKCYYKTDQYKSTQRLYAVSEKGKQVAAKTRATRKANPQIVKETKIYEQEYQKKYILKDEIRIRRRERARERYQKGKELLVYVVNEGSFHKIGWTDHLKERLKNFQIGTPYKQKLIHKIITPNAIELEKQLHAQYAIKKVRGEWFALNDEDITYIKSLN